MSLESQSLSSLQKLLPKTTAQVPAFDQPGVPKYLLQSLPNPSDIRVIFVGEAFGQEEQDRGEPFVGPTGALHRNFLNIAEEIAGVSLPRGSYWIDNLVNIRPPKNDFKLFCGNKTEVGGKSYTKLPVASGKYFHPKYWSHLDGLLERIRYFKPNIVVPLGAPALWACTGYSGIKKYRGCLIRGLPEINAVKCLASWHPAAVGRDWTLRPVIISDLIKALRESQSPELRLPAREICVVENLNDIREAFREIQKARVIETSLRFGVDIETKGDTITCIGISTSPMRAFVFPFYDPRKPDGKYWQDRSVEKILLACLRDFLKDPLSLKVFQNGMYDIQYIMTAWKCPVLGYTDDTQHLSHSQEMEQPKSLGHLGSIFCNLGPWKENRPKGHETEKRDE